MVEYTEVLKAAKDLAEQDIEEAIQKGARLFGSTKVEFFETRKNGYIKNIKNLDKKYPKLNDLISKYKKIILVIKKLAEQDIEEAIQKGARLFGSTKVEFFETRKDSHFVELYKEIEIKKEKAIPLKEKPESCLISKTRTCDVDKLDEKLVFIAGSSDSEFEGDINTILDLLKKRGYNPYFATYNEQFNEDAFCTKICAKIFSCKFCIVMLNSPIHTEAKKHSLDIRFPSANVYFEYGMMTALKKRVIPLLKKNQKLPFNVQHLDVLFYNDQNELVEKLDKHI